MTVHKIAGIDGPGYADYLTAADTVSRRGDYYLGREGAAELSRGTWHGEGARALGLDGDVSRDDLLRVWEGKDPSTGGIVVRRSALGEHVAAVDCTFSAPKSVSVAWALAEPELRASIAAAQDAAVLTAVTHLERSAPLLRRRVAGDIVHERAAGLVAARFRHHTARLSADQAAAGEAPDPQLHDHVAIANMALRHAEAAATSGLWGAIDSRELYRIAAEAGAVYRAELAAGLRRLGFSLHREGRYVEITGIDGVARQAFSARASEVEAAKRNFIATYGRAPTPQEVKTLVMRGRQSKPVDTGPAFGDWRHRATAAGLSPTLVDEVRSSPAATPEPRTTAIEAVIADLTSPASEHFLTTSSAVIDTRHLRIAVAEAAQGRLAGTAFDALLAAVVASDELVPCADEAWTTQATRAAERDALFQARLKYLSRGYSASPLSLHEATATARVALSAEQQTAVQAVTGPVGIALLDAPAGAGKGEVLRVAADAYRRDGRTVLALASAGDTAQRLGAELQAEALSVDAFVHRVATGRLTPTATTVLIVDEVALLETRRWHGLLHAAGPAKVIAAGDEQQLSPIEAGGLWPVFTRRFPTMELTENYRARDKWARDAWTALREGRSRTALRSFADRGFIRIADTRADARVTAVDLWDDGRHRGLPLDRILLLVDGSNMEVDELNQLAQQRRIAAGELGEESVHVLAVEGPTRHLREEDVHAGDHVAFRRAVPVPGSRRRIENGASGLVTAVDPDANAVTVRLRDREVTVQGEDLTAVRLAYAQHVYSAQGRTVDEVYVVTGGWQTDRASGYVAVSRARDVSYVVSDRSSLEVSPEERDAALDELAARFQTARPKTASISVEPELRPEVRDTEPPPISEPASARAIASLSERWTWTNPGTTGRAIADAAADRLRGEGRQFSREDLTVRRMTAMEWRALQRQRADDRAAQAPPALESSEEQRRAALERDLEEMKRHHRELDRQREQERDRDRGLEL